MMGDPIVAAKEPLRIYTDTSVIGGCYDREFAAGSQRLMEMARDGRVVLLISDLVLEELEGAPEPVRLLLRNLPKSGVENISNSGEALRLRDAYLEAAVVGDKWIDDATHVATAAVAMADAIVSWNFRHIVRLDKIKAYNQVNRLYGYPNLTIVTPLEATHAEDPEDN